MSFTPKMEEPSVQRLPPESLAINSLNQKTKNTISLEYKIEQLKLFRKKAKTPASPSL